MTYHAVIGKEQAEKVRDLYSQRVLPTQETEALLGMWAAGWPKKLKKLAEKDELVKALKVEAPALNAAFEHRLSNQHLGMAELLEFAGVTLRL